MAKEPKRGKKSLSAVGNTQKPLPLGAFFLGRLTHDARDANGIQHLVHLDSGSLWPALFSAPDFSYEKRKYENITKRILWLLCSWNGSHRLTGRTSAVCRQPVWMDVAAQSASTGVEFPGCVRSFA